MAGQVPNTGFGNGYRGAECASHALM